MRYGYYRRRPATNRSFRMTARFNGTCSDCGFKIFAGDSILYDRYRKARHPDIAACDAAKLRDLAVANPPLPLTPPPVVNAHPLIDFLEAARARGLKFPKARFLAPDNTSEMLLYIAGPRSRTPGALVVKIERVGWVGTVTPTGDVYGPMANDKVLRDLLDKIALDPAAAAAAYGALKGRCTFCNLELTDEGSVEVGYGGVCAKRWNLPHKHKGTLVLEPVA